ncbi:hypothetical protein WJX73_008359 [Symbiochloris irregularis]|uniref:peptidylprolyl isomerase n=1 Tax=Symbiochloris irregularis TaxID=706552 RepID=A0AAW1PJG0_9CHLO
MTQITPRDVFRVPNQEPAGEQHNPTRRQVALAGCALGLFVHQGLADSAEACDLQKTASGIQYCDLRPGSGASPKQGQMIRCHYEGRLVSNNAVFDSSYERRRPLNFKVGAQQVIKGWDIGILGGEGLPAMQEGGKRRLIIPPELGYGARGAGGIIPPNAALQFDVELLGRR